MNPDAVTLTPPRRRVFSAALAFATLIVALPTPRPLIGQLAGLPPRRRGLRYVRENLVFPLDMGHPIQQPLELFGRKSRAEARDSARDFATRGRDRF